MYTTNDYVLVQLYCEVMYCSRQQVYLKLDVKELVLVESLEGFPTKMVILYTTQLIKLICYIPLMFVEEIDISLRIIL